MSPKVGESTGTELVDIEKQTALVAFSDEVAFNKMIADIKKAVKAVQPDEGYDMSKKADRKALASLAAKIPKVKTKIDAWGAAEVEQKRKEVAAIDAVRKKFKDQLDELKDEVRKPLTDWEAAEESRIEGIKTRMELVKEIGKIGFGETSAQIQERMERMPKDPLDSYDEFKDEAELIIQDVFERLSAAKTIAANAEKEAEDRRKKDAELEELRAKQTEQDRINACKATIVRIKAIGAGLDPEWSGEDSPSSRDLIRILNGIRITPVFGDLFDEASDAKDAAMEQLNKRLSDEIAAEAKRRADEQAAEARQRELDEANQRAAEAEKRLEEKAAADKAAAEASAAEAANVQQQVEQHRVSTHQAQQTSPERKERALAAASAGIAAAIEKANKRSEAPGLILADIIAGRIPHVRFSHDDA